LQVSKRQAAEDIAMYMQSGLLTHG